MVFALASVVEGLEGGGGGAKEDGAGFFLCAEDSDVAGMVARGGVLFVRVLMLFIDDDEA